MPSPCCKRSKTTGSCTRGYTPRRQCAHHLISESPVVLRGKVSVRDVHDVDHAAVTFRPTASHSAAETSPHSWVSFNTLPIVYAMMEPRMCLPAEPQGGKRRGRLCRGGGSGRARERPVLDPWPTMGVARRAVEAERGPSAGEPGWSHAP